MKISKSELVASAVLVSVIFLIFINIHWSILKMENSLFLAWVLANLSKTSVVVCDD